MHARIRLLAFTNALFPSASQWLRGQQISCTHGDESMQTIALYVQKALGRRNPQTAKLRLPPPFTFAATLSGKSFFAPYAHEELYATTSSPKIGAKQTDKKKFFVWRRST